MQLSVSISYIFLLLLRLVHQLQTPFFSSPPDTVASETAVATEAERCSRGGTLTLPSKYLPAMRPVGASSLPPSSPSCGPPVPASLQQNAGVIAVRFPVPLITLHGLRTDGVGGGDFLFS